MSLVLSLDLAEEERRARKLEAAKKKLKSFRATRTPGTSTSTHHSQASSSSTKSSLPSRSPRLGVLPLTTETGGNTPAIQNRVTSKGKGKMTDVIPAEAMLGMGLGGMGHERVRSGGKASGRHRRQNSSISAAPSHSLFRPADEAVEDRRAGLRLDEYKFNMPVPVPREITMTPATPLVEAHELSDPFSFNPPAKPSEEDVGAVKQRLSAFSFGSKPSLSPMSPSRSPTASPNRRQRIQSNPPLSPSVALRSHDLNFALSSLSPDPATSASAQAGLDKLGSGTPSRPPSLLFTNATPLLPSPSAPTRLSHASHPSLAGMAAFDSPSPSTPPTPARKRHSHTRSNSISLSNLKLGGPRPTSLGIPSSPSFPSSPGSPRSPDDPFKGSRTPISGTRLKFEPSEAEMAKEESRRKALEKLNGTSPAASPIIEEAVAEISLPDLEDDNSSTASSSRPLSGAWGSSSSSSSSFSFGRPNSLNSSPAGGHTATPAIEPSLFPAWPDDATPMSFDRWTSGFKEESLGFGMEMMPKRGSFQGGLAVLPEVEETEEEEGEAMWAAAAEDVNEEPSPVAQTPMAQPAPSGLRELHLLSSGPIGTPMRSTLSSDSTSSTRNTSRPAPVSPTKGYGTIGRGRPRPLSGIAKYPGPTSASSPLTATVLTPSSARLPARRRLSGSSRPSSISYKKDRDPVTDGMSIGSSVSSRWSINSRSITSPPLGELSLASPPLPCPLSSSNWSHIPRSANRPCPRPKSLVGLGIQPQGSNRILSEVVERDEGEDVALGLGLGDGWQTAPLPIDRPFTFKAFGSMELDLTGMEVGRRSLDSQGPEGWRDGMLEVEMERDALREDVDGWRERCRGLEERLEDEKRESGVLRERMRKLSDRLLTLSTAPHSPARSAPAQEGRLVEELKGQLFSLTSAFEKERREKEAARQRVAELEAQLAIQHPASTPQWSFSPYSPPSTFEAQQSFAPSLAPSQSSPFGGSGSSAYPWPSTPIVTPATPAMVTPDHSALFASPPVPPKDAFADAESPPQPDLNGFRMRAWGFPSSLPAPTSPSALTTESKQSKRDSFFGLSKVPEATEAEMVETETYDAGVDLPPFILPPHLASLAASPILARTVSDPIPTPPRSFASLHPEDESAGIVKSASATSFSTSAFSLFSGYLPGRASPTKTRSELYSHSPKGAGADRAAGVPDMRFACRCCVGDVLEL